MLIIAIVLLGIERFMDYQWEKEHQEWEKHHEELLEKALQTEDVKYCSGYKQALKCVFLIGQKKQDPSVCDLANLEEPILSGCKASVLEDEEYCKNNLERNSQVYSCEGILYSLTGIGNMLR